MPLGSLTQWQSVLLAVTRFTKAASDSEIEMPKVLAVTVLIIFLPFFFLFEYTDGSVLPILALLEDPSDSRVPERSYQNSKPDSSSLSSGIKHDTDEERPSTEEPTREVPQNDTLFFQAVKNSVLSSFKPAFYACLLNFTASYFLSPKSFPELTSGNFVYAIAFPFVVSTMSGLFGHPPVSSAMTNSRDRTRKYLRGQGGIFSPSSFPGLKIFSVYILITVLLLLIGNYSVLTASTTSHTLSSIICCKLALALPLTGLHTSWIHSVIAKPTSHPGPNFRANFGLRATLATLPAVVLDVVLPTTAYYLASNLLKDIGDSLLKSSSSSSGVDGDLPTLQVASSSSSSTWSQVSASVGIYVPLLLEVLISSFTRAIHTRIAVSLLPIDVPTIIPIKRDCTRISTDQTETETETDSDSNDSTCAPMGIFDAIRSIGPQKWYHYMRFISLAALFKIFPVAVFMAVFFVESVYWDFCAFIDVLLLVFGGPPGA